MYLPELSGGESKIGIVWCQNDEFDLTKNCASRAGSREYKDGAGLPSRMLLILAVGFVEGFLVSIDMQTQLRP